MPFKTDQKQINLSNMSTLSGNVLTTQNHGEIFIAESLCLVEIKNRISSESRQSSKY